MNLIDYAGKIHFIGNVKIGTVVANNVQSNYGHVIGFAKNSSNEIILEIQWAKPWNEDKHITIVHPGNLHILLGSSNETLS